ncbi:MAG: GNAT family N-acetyltransferase [Bacteroidota bacterium]
MSPNIHKTQILTDVQKVRLMNLWNESYPKDLFYNELSEFKAYLNGLEDTQNYLITENENGKIIGWLATFTRSDSRWLILILSSENRRKGLGTILLDEAKKNESILNGWVIDSKNYTKVDGSLYPSPLNFYIKNGFKVLEKDRLDKESISAVRIFWESNQERV